MNSIANGIKTKTIVQNMPKAQQSKINLTKKLFCRKKQTHRSTISQSQNVYVYTHKTALTKSTCSCE